MVLGGVIRLLGEHKNASTRRLFALDERLLVVHIVEEFHLDSLTNVIKDLCQGSILVEKKAVALSGYNPPYLKTQEKTQWGLYGLKAPGPWPANLLIFSGTSVNDITPDLVELGDLMRIHKPVAFSELHFVPYSVWKI